jgi:nanoRNase/pAp phosphatase (c-di-AMP/oligoRNAs hydrolase)
MQKKNLKAIEVGAGITAGIAGALAAGYLLYENTKPQQKKAAAWAMKARAQAAHQAKQLSKIGKSEYHRIVEQAMKQYGALEKINAVELRKVIADAKGEWKHIQAEAKKAAKESKPKTVKRKPVKKSVTKKKRA